jgi:hypothetical protein
MAAAVAAAAAKMTVAEGIWSLSQPVLNSSAFRWHHFPAAVQWRRS